MRSYKEPTAEEKVTELLSEKEIIKNFNISPISNSMCNLGNFLKNYKPPKSPYEGKYVFIR